MAATGESDQFLWNYGALTGAGVNRRREEIAHSVSLCRQMQVRNVRQAGRPTPGCLCARSQPEGSSAPSPIWLRLLLGGCAVGPMAH